MSENVTTEDLPKVIEELENGKNIKYDEKCALEAINLLQDKDFFSTHGLEITD